MAKDKKMVEAITSMEEDFAQWYTDVVKKAELVDYTSVKGCMVINRQVMQSGKISSMSWTDVSRRQEWRMYISPCSSRKVYSRKRRTT